MVYPFLCIYVLNIIRIMCLVHISVSMQCISDRIQISAPKRRFFSHELSEQEIETRIMKLRVRARACVDAIAEVCAAHSYRCH